MKRSDAISIIEDTIHDTYDYDPDLGWTVDYEAILENLEEAIGFKVEGEDEAQ